MTCSIQLLENDLLLVVDVQKDFFTDGVLAIPNAEVILPVINNLVRVFPHVVLTQDWHPKGHSSFASAYDEFNPNETVALINGGIRSVWPDYCVRGTEGARFHPDLNISTAELILRKGYNPDIDSYSAFFENDRATPTGLEGYLRERELDRIFLSGLATDFCIFNTAMDARKLGFEVFVIEDACMEIDIDGSLEDAWLDMGRAGVHRVMEEDLEASVYV